MNLLILDTETNGLNPQEHEVIEIAAVLYSVKHRTVIAQTSALLPAFVPDDHMTGIPPEAFRGSPVTEALEMIARMMYVASYCVAHNAQFDRKFMAQLDPLRDLASKRNWLCTYEDFEWPKPSGSRRLVDIALAHGVGVVAAHRALDDCQMIARLFDVVPDLEGMVGVAIQMAESPKYRYIARATYNQRSEAKALGFHWDSERKEWFANLPEVKGDALISEQDTSFDITKGGQVTVP